MSRYHLRRAAVRALAQPSRSFVSVQSPSSRISSLRSTKPTPYRAFHNTRVWRDQKTEAERAEASPAEAQSSEVTGTQEPSAEEQKSEIKEESIITPDIADASRDAGRNEIRTGSQTVTEQAQEFASSATEKASNLAGAAADAFQNTANSFTPTTSRLNSLAQPSRILYCGNLLYEVTADQLEAEFSRVGKVAKATVILDHRGMSKGFGYVEFATQEEADAALEELSGHTFQGRPMTVQYHIKREKREKGLNTSAPRNPPAKTLFIGNMSYQMSDRDLNDLFREIKDVLDVRVAIDRSSGQPRGFAHADFISVKAAQEAEKLLSKKVLYGRQLRIDFSEGPRKEKPVRSEE